MPLDPCLELREALVERELVDRARYDPGVGVLEESTQTFCSRHWIERVVRPFIENLEQPFPERPEGKVAEQLEGVPPPRRVATHNGSRDVSHGLPRRKSAGQSEGVTRATTPALLERIPEQ